MSPDAAAAYHRPPASGHRRLAPLLPGLSILGGCCGADARHVATLWNV